MNILLYYRNIKLALVYYRRFVLFEEGIKDFVYSLLNRGCLVKYVLAQFPKLHALVL